MVEIGGKPILWHIMKIYSAHGINEFVVCCGYRGYVIKEYFANYFLHMSDVTFDMEHNQMELHQHIDDFSQGYLPHMDKINGMIMSLNIEATKGPITSG